MLLTSKIQKKTKTIKNLFGIKSGFQCFPLQNLQQPTIQQYCWQNVAVCCFYCRDKNYYTLCGRINQKNIYVSFAIVVVVYNQIIKFKNFPQVYNTKSVEGVYVD